MKQLLILRHGKSDAQSRCDDIKRPLKDGGKRNAQRIGAWLQQNHLIPERIVSSPAVRAKTTAEKCAKVMGFNGKQIKLNQHLYLADLTTLMEIIHALPEQHQTVMLVGHNPGLEELLCHLAPSDIPTTESGKILTTANLACLSFNSEWKEIETSNIKLEHLIRPNDLPQKFPFLDHDSDEERPRPAYYYSQSSVIPYRINQGKLEILIIRSSKNKHWVIPKGIVEPGMTPQASAAKEAHEEAGIEGTVGEEMLGKYEYLKWDGTCKVAVYPMEVSRLLSNEEWQENHRSRQWVSISMALANLKEQGLFPMFKQLLLCHEGNG